MKDSALNMSLRSSIPDSVCRILPTRREANVPFSESCVYVIFPPLGVHGFLEMPSFNRLWSKIPQKRLLIRSTLPHSQFDSLLTVLPKPSYQGACLQLHQFQHYSLHQISLQLFHLVVRKLGRLWACQCKASPWAIDSTRCTPSGQRLWHRIEDWPSPSRCWRRCWREQVCTHRYPPWQQPTVWSARH
jgi:hypothetical protein